ncbi:hypothetical protein FCN80_24615 [Martelella alba]|uniref:Uncharacterized protein n=1 Tax=Martelella alba TaxID=2590451 RepID=A0ABY2SDK8_9HYPH|nr:hypothetical protein FCN80_24615 [Martelella alba]
MTRLTYVNGYRINGQPSTRAEIEPIFDEQLTAWEKYEQLKKDLREMNLSPDEYQRECRRIADALGI